MMKMFTLHKKPCFKENEGVLLFSVVLMACLESVLRTEWRVILIDMK